DFVVLYTQAETFSNGSIYDDPDVQNTKAPTNIYYRRFDEATDTAGPRVTDLVKADGTYLENNVVLETELQYLVITFDEEMMGGDPAAVADSVFNTDNYLLFEEGNLIDGGIGSVTFGMNAAATLSGVVDPATGVFYDTSPIPSNKWEVVLTFDGNGFGAGTVPLGDGFYSLEILSPTINNSGLRDKAGNPLFHTGFLAGGASFIRDFRIKASGPPHDMSVTNGRTYPETPNAVAVDADGDTVVVLTASDARPRGDGNTRDRVNIRLFDATGSTDLNGNQQEEANEKLFAVTKDTDQQGDPDYWFRNDDQRFASVAVDADGDFIVTWTNYHDENGDGNFDEPDIFARRFTANGQPATDANGNVLQPFRVNTYTANNQKWSDVAMDVDGDFVVTWSSYGQEDNNQLGYGYGVYARHYDSFGQPRAPEFRVNVTTAGNQQFSTVAMDSVGNFIIAWTSDQNGIGDDIVAREFNANGSPVIGPLGGEIMVNETTIGDQRYPDISMNLSGDQYVVTWSAAGQDGSGSAVYGRIFSRATSTLFVPNNNVDLMIPDVTVNPISSVLTVANNALILDLDVEIELSHDSPQDLTATLVGPDGTAVVLFTGVPTAGPTGNIPAGSNFNGTILDDDPPAPGVPVVPINTPGLAPPFAGRYAPMNPLTAFDGTNVNGSWQLLITDNVGNDRSGMLERWALVVQRTSDPAHEHEFRVNTTAAGNQTYSSVAMDHSGGFVVTWSGFGNQPNQEDESGSGVYLQRFEPTSLRMGGETRINMTTEG
ncbi:MAG TPA: hypothetical protein VE890_04805, partial [Thermoguttaceae bacterium]|nr:hypothetical protein [Thermoguttaceae bacterium]